MGICKRVCGSLCANMWSVCVGALLSVLCHVLRVYVYVCECVYACEQCVVWCVCVVCVCVGRCVVCSVCLLRDGGQSN